MESTEPITGMEQIYLLYGRKVGLGRQMITAGRWPIVYDHLYTISLRDLNKYFLESQGMWFAPEFDNLPLEESENPVVICGFFQRGYFNRLYVSFPKYAALRTTPENADRFRKAFQMKGASDILVGREMNKKATDDLASQFKRQRLEDKVRDIMALSK